MYRRMRCNGYMKYAGHTRSIGRQWCKVVASIPARRNPYVPTLRSLCLNVGLLIYLFAIRC